jgi:hypothetical protein
LDFVPPKHVQHLTFGLALTFEDDERVAVAVTDSVLIDGATKVLNDHPPVRRFIPILAPDLIVQEGESPLPLR